MAATAHQRRVRRYADQPGRKLRFTAKGAKTSIRLEKRLLNRIFCLSIVSQYGACGSKNRALVQAHQPFKSARVSRQNRCDEFGVCHGCSRTKLLRGERSGPAAAVDDPSVQRARQRLPGPGKADDNALRSEVCVVEKNLRKNRFHS